MASESQIYVKPEDKRRIEQLAKSEFRSLSSQITVIVNEAYQRRGIELPSAAAKSAATAGARRAG